MKIFFTAIFCLLLCAKVYAAHPYNEKYYQTLWCAEQNGIMEYKLPDATRVDCLTQNHAVEFDFAPKWAESVGQSLYYANCTGRKPAIVLILEKPADMKYYARAKVLADKYGIALWTMKSPCYCTVSP